MLVPAVEQSVNIQVHFDESDGPITPVWNYFGYDEPNYTYVLQTAGNCSAN
jgi:hypothetical protein